MDPDPAELPPAADYLTLEQNGDRIPFELFADLLYKNKQGGGFWEDLPWAIICMELMVKDVQQFINARRKKNERDAIMEKTKTNLEKCKKYMFCLSKVAEKFAQGDTANIDLDKELGDDANPLYSLLTISLLMDKLQENALAVGMLDENSDKDKQQDFYLRFRLQYSSASNGHQPYLKFKEYLQDAKKEPETYKMVPKDVVWNGENEPIPIFQDAEKEKVKEWIKKHELEEIQCFTPYNFKSFPSSKLTKEVWEKVPFLAVNPGENIRDEEYRWYVDIIDEKDFSENEEGPSNNKGSENNQKIRKAQIITKAQIIRKARKIRKSLLDAKEYVEKNKIPFYTMFVGEPKEGNGTTAEEEDSDEEKITEWLEDAYQLVCKASEESNPEDQGSQPMDAAEESGELKGYFQALKVMSERTRELFGVLQDLEEKIFRWENKVSSQRTIEYVMASCQISMEMILGRVDREIKMTETSVRKMRFLIKNSLDILTKSKQAESNQAGDKKNNHNLGWFLRKNLKVILDQSFQQALQKFLDDQDLHIQIFNEKDFVEKDNQKIKVEQELNKNQKRRRVEDDKEFDVEQISPEKRVAIKSNELETDDVEDDEEFDVEQISPEKRVAIKSNELKTDDILEDDDDILEDDDEDFMFEDMKKCPDPEMYMSLKDARKFVGKKSQKIMRKFHCSMHFALESMFSEEEPYLWGNEEWKEQDINRIKEMIKSDDKNNSKTITRLEENLKKHEKKLNKLKEIISETTQECFSQRMYKKPGMSLENSREERAVKLSEKMEEIKKEDSNAKRLRWEIGARKRMLGIIRRGFEITAPVSAGQEGHQKVNAILTPVMTVENIKGMWEDAKEKNEEAVSVGWEKQLLEELNKRRIDLGKFMGECQDYYYHLKKSEKEKLQLRRRDLPEYFSKKYSSLKVKHDLEVHLLEEEFDFELGVPLEEMKKLAERDYKDKLSKMEEEEIDLPNKYKEEYEEILEKYQNKYIARKSGDELLIRNWEDKLGCVKWLVYQQGQDSDKREEWVQEWVEETYKSYVLKQDFLFYLTKVHRFNKQVSRYTKFITHVDKQIMTIHVNKTEDENDERKANRFIKEKHIYKLLRYMRTHLECMNEILKGCDMHLEFTGVHPQPEPPAFFFNSQCLDSLKDQISQSKYTLMVNTKASIELMDSLTKQASKNLKDKDDEFRKNIWSQDYAYFQGMKLVSPQEWWDAIPEVEIFGEADRAKMGLEKLRRNRILGHDPLDNTIYITSDQTEKKSLAWMDPIKWTADMDLCCFELKPNRISAKLGMVYNADWFLKARRNIDNSLRILDLSMKSLEHIPFTEEEKDSLTKNLVPPEGEDDPMAAVLELGGSECRAQFKGELKAKIETIRKSHRFKADPKKKSNGMILVNQRGLETYNDALDMILQFIRVEIIHTILLISSQVDEKVTWGTANEQENFARDMFQLMVFLISKLRSCIEMSSRTTRVLKTFFSKEKNPGERKVADLEAPKGEKKVSIKIFRNKVKIIQETISHCRDPGNVIFTQAWELKMNRDNAVESEPFITVGKDEMMEEENEEEEEDGTEEGLLQEDRLFGPETKEIFYGLEPSITMALFIVIEDIRGLLVKCPVLLGIIKSEGEEWMKSQEEETNQEGGDDSFEGFVEGDYLEKTRLAEEEGLATKNKRSKEELEEERKNIEKRRPEDEENEEAGHKKSKKDRKQDGGGDSMVTDGKMSAKIVFIKPPSRRLHANFMQEIGILLKFL